MAAFEPDTPSALGAPGTLDSCALDEIAESPATDSTTVSREGAVRLVGWAADGLTATVPPVVVLELSNAGKKYYAPAARLVKRPDVAAALKMPALVDSGYAVSASFAKVEPGAYDVKVMQVTPSGMAYTCETRRKLNVQ